MQPFTIIQMVCPYSIRPLSPFPGPLLQGALEAQLSGAPAVVLHETPDAFLSARRLGAHYHGFWGVL